MLDVLLCGASDTAEVRDSFGSVVNDFGGTPLHYMSGDIQYVNAAVSSWDKNSQASVQTADLCVFVIVRALGTITWTTEFREVVTSGKPFIVLCLDETYNRYLSISKTTHDDTSHNLAENDRSLFATLDAVEREYQVTVVPYPASSFGEVLRRQLAMLYAIGLQLVEAQNRRRFLQTLLRNPDGLSTQQIGWTIELAVDEMASKDSRKHAITALAKRHAADEDTVLVLLGSPEQGVQRLAFSLLPDLYPTRPPTDAFLSAVVDIVNGSDDVGVGRRLVQTLFSFDLASALRATERLELTDIGLRRRLTEQLETHEDAIAAQGLIGSALQLAERCRVGNDNQDWKQRLKRFIERHSPSD